MSNHTTSVPARQRRGTQNGRPKLRPRVAPLAMAQAGDSERAFSTLRTVTGRRLDRLAGLPGLPSESRLSHLRHDEAGPLHFLDALIRAKVAIGDPVEECGLIPLHLWETVEMSLSTNRVPLSRALLSERHHDSAEDIAAAELWASGLGTGKLELLVARLRVELASKRTLLTSARLELVSRGAA